MPRWGQRGVAPHIPLPGRTWQMNSESLKRFIKRF
eukprot:Gb_15492 [translate_table: standard]